MSYTKETGEEQSRRLQALCVRITRKSCIPNYPKASHKRVKKVEAAGLRGLGLGDWVWEEEAMCEDGLTALGTSAALGRFEWSRAKIVYSERKAGSAIIPASS